MDLINIKKWVIGILLFDVLLLLWVVNQKRSASVTPIPAEAENRSEEGTPKEGDEELFVLKGKDQENQTITVYNIKTTREETLSYSSATSIKNRYDGEMTMNGLQEGEMIDVVYDVASRMISHIGISKKAWEYQKVHNIKIYGNENRIQIGDRNYRIQNNPLVFSGSECIDLMSINEMDELMIKGIEKNIYSLIVTRGHGYIRPSNYEAFVDGMVSVGRDVIRPITEDMLIVVREGTYNVTMQNGNLIGTKSIVVTKNAETPLDMIDFKPEPEPIGKVEFEISPYGADLYINGKLTDYQKAVSLNYGKHQVRVSLTGYEDYNAVLDVQTPNPTIVVDLADSNSKVDDGNDKTDSANYETNIEGTSSKDNMEDVVLDKNHTITVSEPSGVSVYFNGVYKGIAPCSFTKQVGTHTITLSGTGSTTKSYMVEIANDQENVEWKFPAIY